MKKSRWIVRLQKYSLFSRIQAGIATFTLLFTMLHPPMALLGNPVDIPSLQLGGYNSALMQSVYDQTYYLNSLQDWQEVADHYVGLLRANWEASADAAIQNYIDSIATSDSVNSVADYKDFMQKALESQKLDLLAGWEEEAGIHLLYERDDFVHRLTTGIYRNTIENTSVSVQNANLPANPDQYNSQLVSALESSQTDWKEAFSTNYQQGINQFNTNLQSIEKEYETFIQQLNQNQTVFSSNLEAINRYQTNVKNFVKSTIEGMKADLDDPDNAALYKDTSRASGYSIAGETLDGLIDTIMAVLNDPNPTLNNLFTNLSTAIEEYLEEQVSQTQEIADGHADGINTMYTNVSSM